MSDPDIYRRLAALEKWQDAMAAVELPRLNYGSAFPASWPQDVPFYRTDVDFWCVYNGSIWLTTHEYIGTVLIESTTTAGNYVGIENRTDYAPYITRVAVGRITATTNNLANHWTWSVRGINAGYSAATAIYAANTAADTAGTWAHNDTSSVTTTPANYTRWDVDIAKTGAPGAIILLATIWYRLIIP